MKLVLDTRRLRDMHKQRVTSWELVLLLFLEEVVETDDWTELPINRVQKELGITPSTQSRLLKGLKAHGLVDTRIKGFGEVRRQVRLTRTATAN